MGAVSDVKSEGVNTSGSQNEELHEAAIEVLSSIMSDEAQRTYFDLTGSDEVVDSAGDPVELPDALSSRAEPECRSDPTLPRLRGGLPCGGHEHEGDDRRVDRRGLGAFVDARRVEEEPRWGREGRRFVFGRGEQSLRHEPRQRRCERYRADPRRKPGESLRYRFASGGPLPALLRRADRFRLALCGGRILRCGRRI